MRSQDDFAEAARHVAITAHMERSGQLHEALQELVGDDAMTLLFEHIEAIPDEPEAQARPKPGPCVFANEEESKEGHP